MPSGNSRRLRSNCVPALAACAVLLTAPTLVAQNAYITNSFSTGVSVINTATNTVIATIPTDGGTAGVAVTPDGSHVYVTEGLSVNDNLVWVIDTATNAVTATIPVSFAPFGIAVTPDGSKVYVSNVFGQSVSLIDTATNTVIATIPGFGRAYGVAITPDGSHVYVTDAFFGAVFVISTATNMVTATIPGIGAPVGVAITPDGSKVYVADTNSNNVSVIATGTNTVIAIIPVGNLPSDGVAITPDGSKVYLADSDSVSVINTATNTVIATVPVGSGGPVGIAVTPDGSEVYVAENNSNSVSVIDTATNTVTSTVPVGSAPIAFGKFIQPSKIFSAFSAKLNLVPGPSGSFALNTTFVLAPMGSIDPVTEPLTFTIGSYIVTIPAGSFHQLKNGAKNGGWVFSGNLGGVNLSIQIDPLGGNAYQFKATGSPVDFTGVTSPAVVSISINGNSGKTKVKF